jgi:hypothetical protein
VFVTSQGSAHGRFTRAIQQRNLAWGSRRRRVFTPNGEVFPPLRGRPTIALLAYEQCRVREPTAARHVD